MVRQRNAYDFVKVKVLLCADGADGGATRGYVLSRFLLCRQLTAIGVPHAKAVKIALELKKRLVDEGRLEVSHAEMEACLLELLSACGFGSAEYTDNYHMMARFHHQRTPLLVVVCGVPCTGKSTLAAKLAQTLNFQNVLQLDALADASSGDSGSAWGRLTSFNENISGASSSATRAAFGELKKAVTEGKSVIVDGAHAHPRLIAEAVRSACGAPKQAAAGAAGRVGEAPDRARAEDGVDCTPGEAAAPRLSACDDDGQVLIVNIAVQMDRQAHASLLREWISRRQGCLAEGEFCSLLQSLQGVQEAMCDYVERSGGIVVNMTPTTHGLQMCTATVQAHVLGLIRAFLKPASSCAEPHLA